MIKHYEHVSGACFSEKLFYLLGVCTPAVESVCFKITGEQAQPKNKT